MSRSNTTREQSRAIELIRNSTRVFVGTHVRPDGDALGSLLGIALALEALGKRVACLCPDPVPADYAFLPGAERVTREPPDWPPDLGIAVDCDGLARLGHLESVFASIPHLIDIDHHGANHTFGEAQVIDPTAGAASEIVFDLVAALGVPLDERIATCLYTGILTDTGRFSFGNTTAASLKIAAALVDAGARPEVVARKVYEERSIVATHLLGVALSRLRAESDGDVVSSALALGDFAETGAAPPDTEGIIDHLRAIGGPRVAILFVQVDHGQVRVSLRSDGSVDVSAIAVALGGGGHAMAAGCVCSGELDEVRRRVLAAVGNALAAPDSRDGA